MNPPSYPQALLDFIAKQIKIDAACMFPQNYPENGDLEAFQDGYKDEDTNGQPGFLKPSHYVVCSNYFADPFIVDLAEEGLGLPVYFAFHGAGSWTLLPIASTLADFETVLGKIKTWLDAGEKDRALAYIANWFDRENNAFWKETYAELNEPEMEDTPPAAAWTEEDRVHGKLFITHLGTHKLKVVQRLQAQLGLTPQAALDLSKQPAIEYAAGLWFNLKHDLAGLEKLGATALFKPNAEMDAEA